VHTIGEALRLPRAGFARRFGKPQLAMLDQLTGRNADLRTRFQVRERFQRRHPLLYELEHHEAILATLEPLLQELGEFLKARQCGITRLECLLQHRHAPATRCVLRLAEAAASARHFTKLLGERLAALSLPEPVRAFELRSGGLVPRAPAADSLWQPGEHGGGPCAESPELIEHLRARLGHEAVYGVQILAAHRPETAWAATELAATTSATMKPAVTKTAATKAASPQQLQSSLGSFQRPASQSRQVAVPSAGRIPPWPAFRRPIWLVPVPQLLHEREGLPRCRGPLRLLGGPERVETGWWDGGDIARDYYVALDIHGVRLWIFRERTPPHRWFLQGVFG
jgi:protein ImuB